MDSDSRQIQHGYGHDPGSRQLGEVEGTLAYHLRRHRKEYGSSGISQKALAMIAHVSPWFVENIERSTKLPNSVETLLRVALAVRRPVEELVSPAHLRVLRDEIERRRGLLGGTARLEAEAPADVKPKIILAVAYRSPHLMTAISDGKTVLDLRQRRVSSLASAVRLRSLIAREARSYGTPEVIVETDTPIAAYAASQGIPHRTLSFKQAKQHLLPSPGGAVPSNKVFFAALIAKHAELGRYVKVLQATGRVAMTEHWRIMRLVIASLALAAPAAKAPTPPSMDAGHAGRSAPRLQP